MAANKLFHRIGETCKILDIQPYVLRYWETEFPALKPDKSRSGQRVYSEEDIATIRRIKELLYDEGYTIAGAKKKLEGERSGGSAPRVTVAAGVESSEAAAPEVEPDDSQPEEPAVEESAAEPESSEPSPSPEAKKKAKTKSRKRAVEKASATEGPDPAAAETIQQLRAGIEQALSEAREILALLEK